MMRITHYGIQKSHHLRQTIITQLLFEDLLCCVIVEKILHTNQVCVDVTRYNIFLILESSLNI